MVQVARMRYNALAFLFSLFNFTLIPGNAIDVEHREIQEYTALMKHVDFFDVDGDGLIGNAELYSRLRALGFSPLAALPSVAVFGTALGFMTNKKWFRNFSVDISNIARVKHASATQIYSPPDGALDAALKDSLFLQYDTNGDISLSMSEMNKLINDMAKSASGKIRSVGEIGLLYMLAGEVRQLSDGSTERFISKVTWDKLYEGTLFYDMTGISPHTRP